MVVNIHDAKTHFSAYLNRALQGEEIIVARAGKPVAKLVALKTQKPGKRKLGIYEGQMQVPDAFFEPMSEDEIKDWYDGPVYP